MVERRTFLHALAAGVGAAALRPSLLWAAAPPEIKTALNGPIGLQLWSLRKSLPADVPGTLARLRDLGIRHVETAGLPKDVSAADYRAMLDRTDLVCRAGHMGYARVKDDAAGAVAELKTLGAKYVVCPWIDHGPRGTAFSREHALQAADVFNKAGKAAAAEGMKFAYHPHGYEFVPSDEGTLFDTIAKNTDPALVGFEVDIFWAKAGGADPAKLIAGLPGRVPLMHIKDMKKGLVLPTGSSGAPEDSDVAAGQGQLDLPAIFKAAIASKMEIYYIEDESTKPWEQIPQSLAYLSALKL
jgi:sugar phosphate isomerase/epimerase